MSAELTAPQPQDGHCPVCAGTLGEGRVVACARCETAHHLDCIEYGGGCAVYACGSHAYRRPGARLEFVARPAPAATALVKQVEVRDIVQTLAQPVLRVEARRDRRSLRLAYATAFAGAAGLVWVVASLTAGKWAGVMWFLAAIRELVRMGMWPVAIVAIVVLMVLYLAVTLGGDATLYGLGMLIHRADTSEYAFDREARRLVRRPRLLGLPGPSRSWPASAIRGVRLIADRGTDRVRLEAVLDGAPLVLADDSDTYLTGYHWSELARLGQRLATELDVPLEWLVPWKPHPGQKKLV